MKLASAAACDEGNMPVMEGYTCCYTSYMNNTCATSDPPDDAVFVTSTDFEAFKNKSSGSWGRLSFLISPENIRNTWGDWSRYNQVRSREETLRGA